MVRCTVNQMCWMRWNRISVKPTVQSWPISVRTWVGMWHHLRPTSVDRLSSFHEDHLKPNSAKSPQCPTPVAVVTSGSSLEQIAPLETSRANRRLVRTVEDRVVDVGLPRNVVLRMALSLLDDVDPSESNSHEDCSPFFAQFMQECHEIGFGRETRFDRKEDGNSSCCCPGCHYTDLQVVEE